MSASPRAFLRRLYRALPFKRQAFLALRTLWRPPERIFKHLHFEGTFRVPVAGSSFRLHHFGFQIENEIFWTGLDHAWEPMSMRLWIQLVRSATSVADVGANHGVYALVAKAVNPDAHVAAFEPVARVHARLRQNVELNDFDIECFEVAVSDTDGSGTLYDPGTPHILSVTLGVDTTPAGGHSVPVQVQTVTLAALVREGRLTAPDLLKIDVETHEPQVLRGMGPFLESRPTMLIEILTDGVADAIQEIVAPLGYAVFDIDEATGSTRRLDRVRPAASTNLLLCRPDVAAALGL